MPPQSIQSMVFDYVQSRAGVLMLVMNADERILQTNAFTRELVGKPLTGTPFKDVIVDFEDRIDPFLLARNPDTLHLINVNTHSRQPQTFYCQFLPLDSGVLVLGSLDITEQEKLRAELLLLNQESSNLTRQLHKANISLEKLNQMKNQFLGMAAHDLRKPVGIVMAYSDFLLDEARSLLSEEHVMFLDTIRRSADFMKRLIDNFLDASLIDSGRFHLEMGNYNLDGILNSALEMVSLAAKKKSTRILVETHAELPPLYLDAAKIEQVLMNILSNAVEYSPPHSMVSVCLTAESQHAVIRVSDQGPGIPDSEVQNLFQIYGRTGARKTAGERSIGLGLAISRKIMDQHGGSITVNSRVGEGSIFQIRIPLKPAAVSGISE